MSTITGPAPASEVIYPDSDGRPMADNTLQYKWIVLIKEGLEFLFRDRADVFIAADLLWYAEEGRKGARMAPDVLVVFGRPKGDRGSYRQWEEDGIAPQVVFEIHSPSNSPNDIMRKFAFYDLHGVEEYYYYDPATGDLWGWLRKDGRLEDGIEMNGFTSPRLGIRFEPLEGPDSLRILGPDGSPFVSPLETAKRAERLAAKLRELGIEPD